MPGVGAGEEEEVVHEAGHARVLGLDRGERAGVFVGGAGGGEGVGGFQVDDAEGGAEFVAGVGGELALAGEGGFQAVEHGVEGGGEGAEFVAPGEVEAAAEVGRADLGGGLVDQAHRAHGAGGEPVAADGGEEQGGGSRQEQGEA
ncbi:MAG: hypothetical protein U0232_20710 [Thermomicrobiales bacterium]